LPTFDDDAICSRRDAVQVEMQQALQRRGSERPLVGCYAELGRTADIFKVLGNEVVTVISRELRGRTPVTLESAQVGSITRKQLDTLERANARRYVKCGLFKETPNVGIRARFKKSPRDCDIAVHSDGYMQGRFAKRVRAVDITDTGQNDLHKALVSTFQRRV
jgi:hypothetical protein